MAVILNQSNLTFSIITDLSEINLLNHLNLLLSLSLRYHLPKIGHMMLIPGSFRTGMTRPYQCMPCRARPGVFQTAVPAQAIKTG